MAIVFDHDFGRVWSDGTTPYVFSSVIRVPGKDELDELAHRQLELVRELKRKFGDVYSILDLRLCPVVPSHIILYYVTKIVPLQFKAGLRHKALVAPEKKEALEVLVKAFHSITNLSISMHSSFESALSIVNEKRTEVNSHSKRRFILGFLSTTI